MCKWLLITPFLLLLGLPTGSAASELAGVHDVHDFGAAGDGAHLDSRPIQQAIDACAAGGGGTVHFPAGTYRCGSLHLKSRVRLHLDHGATLLGSTRKGDYDPFEEVDFENDADWETSYFHHALIWGEDVEGVVIEGGGVIDSNFKSRKGPKPIALKRCQEVRIKGITIRNAPNYAISMLGCDEVSIDGVRIENGYCDGIDPDSCRNVRISNCFVDTLDDAIVPKASFSLGELRTCEDITVTNCVLSTVCNGFKLGTESGGGFRRIAVTNCVITGHKSGRPAISGISLESVDGGVLADVAISNITMRNVRSPIFLRLGNRGRDMAVPAPGALRNVSVNNIVVNDASMPCSIVGIPGQSVQGVTLSNLRMTFIGSNPRHATGAPIPEYEAAYPEALMFGTLPAYGLYCRHVQDLKLSNIKIDYVDSFWRLTTDAYRDIRWPGGAGMPSHAKPADAGHALFCDDVEGLDIDGFAARPSRDGAPVIRFNAVTHALIRGCVAGPGTQVFLETDASSRVHCESNAFADGVTPVQSAH